MSIEEQEWLCVSCGDPADTDIEGEPMCLACWQRDTEDAEGGDG